MDNSIHPAEKAKKIREYQCLKIVEGIMRNDYKTADKFIKQIIEKRIENKAKHILNSTDLI